jgi:hypothetical protein
MHAVDPQWYQNTIRDDGATEMHWTRWEDWQKGDPECRTGHRQMGLAAEVVCFRGEEGLLVADGHGVGVYASKRRFDADLSGDVSNVPLAETP